MAMWPDGGGNGGRIDATIDETARRMSDGAPGGDFKARVLARIGERQTASGRWWLWLTVPMATAVIVFLVVVGRSGDSGNRGSESARTRPQPTETARRQPEPAINAPAAQSQTRQTPAPVRLKPDTTDATDGSLRRPFRRPALRVARSEVDALAPATLAVESIHLEALPPADSIRLPPLETIDPIDVAPLAAPEIDESPRRQP